MSNELFAVLALAAVTAGSLHTLAPDHWVPFAALARSERWSAGRTAGVTLLCGLGHVTTSVLLGLLGLAFGLKLIQEYGAHMEAIAGILLIGFGLAYGVIGLRRAAGTHLHGHAHVHYDHVHDRSRKTVWALFLLFAADPCVAVIPLLFAAAPLGGLRTTAIVLLYEAATLGTMVGLVLPARAAVRVVRGAWLDRYGEAATGALIVFVGLVVAGLGW
jgi:nickel/cobalt exporter